MTKFGGDPDHRLDPGIFNRFFNHCTHKQYWGCLGRGGGFLVRITNNNILLFIIITTCDTTLEKNKKRFGIVNWYLTYFDQLFSLY